MKKILSLSVLLMAFATQDAMGALSGSGTEEDPCEIGSVDDWNEFCSSFGSENGKKVVVTGKLSCSHHH